MFLHCSGFLGTGKAGTPCPAPKYPICNLGRGRGRQGSPPGRDQSDFSPQPQPGHWTCPDLFRPVYVGGILQAKPAQEAGPWECVQEFSQPAGCGTCLRTGERCLDPPWSPSPIPVWSGRPGPGPWTTPEKPRIMEPRFSNLRSPGVCLCRVTSLQSLASVGQSGRLWKRAESKVHVRAKACPGAGVQKEKLRQTTLGCESLEHWGCSFFSSPPPSPQPCLLHRSLPLSFAGRGKDFLKVWLSRRF